MTPIGIPAADEALCTMTEFAVGCAGQELVEKVEVAVEMVDFV